MYLYILDDPNHGIAVLVLSLCAGRGVATSLTQLPLQEAPRQREVAGSSSCNIVNEFVAKVLGFLWRLPASVRCARWSYMLISYVGRDGCLV